jgi:serralysin
VAVGDVTGDGRADLVVGAGEGLRSQVKVFRGQVISSKAGVEAANPVAAANIFAFGDTYTGGVRVAVGDVNGDGIGDLIAAPGAGAAPVVKVFTTKAAWGDAPLARYHYTLTTMTVGGKADTGGVFVSAGDVNGDGKADIAVGRVTGATAVVTVYKGTDTKAKLLEGYGFTPTGSGGVPVAVKDLDGDGKAEVLAAGGAGTSQVRVLGGSGGLTRSFMAFTPNYQGGVYVG